MAITSTSIISAESPGPLASEPADAEANPELYADPPGVPPDCPHAPNQLNWSSPMRVNTRAA
eukprot:CAMPEP_0114246906 /NCGR_PEP_ID=MMETSP0058-20121206/12730_1 /TAXON_ID=36894 /ORGANISM="Pyramimonas parkeae, CCMP726" /LENGTH=61 /DNA_ID=CAMNT_0001360159 /DNA_START=238 /DNA_END=423 /DNA_ORIENTATION=+